MKYRTDTVAINGPVAKGVAIYHVKYVKPSYTTYCVHAPFIRDDCNEKFRNVNSEQLLSFNHIAVQHTRDSEILLCDIALLKTHYRSHLNRITCRQYFAKL